MTKNGGMIHVFDSDGNEIGQTYPKRAEGLIKKGRARRISVDSIVLCGDTESDTDVCPTSDTYTGDNLMNTDNNKTIEPSEGTGCERCEFEYDLKHYVQEQIENAKERYNALVDDLYIELNDGVIDEETYRRRYKLLGDTTDARVIQLLGMLK